PIGRPARPRRVRRRRLGTTLLIPRTRPAARAVPTSERRTAGGMKVGWLGEGFGRRWRVCRDERGLWCGFGRSRADRSPSTEGEAGGEAGRLAPARGGRPRVVWP